MKSRENPEFPTTHWTLVQTIRTGDSEEVAEALDEVCQNYWYPVYAFLRRSGKGEQDAEDLTQAFFAKLISEETLQHAEQERGKLRTFLLAVLNRMLVDDTRHRMAEKRGGGQPVFSLDHLDAEERYRNEPTDSDDPEKIYLRAWANQVIDASRNKLKSAFEKEGRESLYQKIEPFLTTDEDTPPYAKLANELNSSEGAVRLLVHRTRKKFRAQLEKDVAKTVIDAKDVDEELDWLKSALASA
ncbi:MAG: ECF-type sigma factor [Verrucomicrobiota bacterium]